jgi:hypothetical protein
MEKALIVVGHNAQSDVAAVDGDVRSRDGLLVEGWLGRRSDVACRPGDCRRD